MRSPYRVKDEVSREERPHAELVYRAGDAERHIAPARLAIQVGIAGTTCAVVAAAAGLPELCLGVLAGAAMLGAWRWRRAPEVLGLLFRVEEGALLVTARGSNEVIARTRLVDLRDVSLDTKSIRKVEPGRDAVPAVQFINTQIGPEIDVARIVLVVAGRPAPIRLTDAFLAHTDSVESIAKIRVFLRSHGWLPEDERMRLSDPGAEDTPDANDVAEAAHASEHQAGADEHADGDEVAPSRVR